MKTILQDTTQLNVIKHFYTDTIPQKLCYKLKFFGQFWKSKMGGSPYTGVKIRLEICPLHISCWLKHAWNTLLWSKQLVFLRLHIYLLYSIYSIYMKISCNITWNIQWRTTTHLLEIAWCNNGGSYDKSMKGIYNVMKQTIL